jgi:hypothetical protein
MSLIKHISNSKTNKVLLALLLSGLLIMLLPFTLLRGEQCPAGYTQAAIDASNCIIGANIGSGLLLIFGAYIALVALVTLGVSLASARFRNLGPGKKILIVIAIAALVYVIASWILYLVASGSVN